jgi:cupin 2 domain-containing protein
MQIQPSNLFEHIPAELPGELAETLFEGEHMRAERIVSRGHCSPHEGWYDQDEDEWVILLKGGARLIFDGADEMTELAPGDYIHIPAHVRHRVAWTDPDKDTVWLAIFFQPAKKTG